LNVREPTAWNGLQESTVPLIVTDSASSGSKTLIVILSGLPLGADPMQTM
jgi:hypothetical protein